MVYLHRSVLGTLIVCFYYSSFLSAHPTVRICSWLRNNPLWSVHLIQRRHSQVFCHKTTFRRSWSISIFLPTFCCKTANYARLPPFSLIRDFGKRNTGGNVSKISVNLTWYRHIGSKSTNHSPLAWRREGQKVTLVAVIGGFRSDMSITRKIDGNFGNVSAGVSLSKVAYQRKRW